MLAGAFILYSLYYFEIEPPYLCKDIGPSEWTSCTSKDICVDH